MRRGVQYNVYKIQTIVMEVIAYFVATNSAATFPPKSVYAWLWLEHIDN